MFKVHKKLGYALISLKHMYQKSPEELSTAKEISDQYCMPFDAVSRVLQIMAHSGLLKSVQGPSGGYHISKDPSETSFLDLVEMILGSVNITHCMSQKASECRLVESCNMVEPIMLLNKQLKVFYETLSLEKLLKTPGGRL